MQRRDTHDDNTKGEGRMKSSERASTVGVALLVALFTGARLWRLTASCLWFDEIFGVHAARHAWGEMLAFIAADLVHPPLFYLLLKLWIALGGDSLLWLRLFPLLAATLALAPLLLLCRELKLTPAETRLTLLLFAVNGYLIKYAQEVRMYSLLLLLALMSLWLFARFCVRAGAHSRMGAAAMFVVNLLLVYTHYYGWLLVLSEAALLCRRRRERLWPFVLMTAALALCFAPWVYAVAGEAASRSGGLAQNIGWAARPGVADVAGMLILLHEPFYFRQSSGEPLTRAWSTLAGLLLLALPVLLLAVRDARRTEDAEGARQALLLRWLLTFSLLPLALAFALSYLLPHSIWGTRHLIIIAAPYLVLVAVAVNRLRPPRLRQAALVCLGGWLFFASLLALARREGPYIWCAWENLAAHAIEEEGATTPAAAADAQATAAEAGIESIPVYAFEDLVAYHLWFALDAHGGGRRFEVGRVTGVPGLLEDTAYFLPRNFTGVRVRDISAVEEPRIWIAFRDTAWDEARPPLAQMKARGYTPARVFDYSAQGQRAFLVLLLK